MRRRGCGVVPMQRGVEFYPFAISSASSFAFGQESSEFGLVGYRERLVEQAVEKFLEPFGRSTPTIHGIDGVDHVAAFAMSVFSIQSRSVRRILRSVSDTALGCLPIAAAIMLTDTPGS